MVKMIVDYFKFALNGIARKGIRSWLTMIGIFIGITSVVALVSVGQGFQNAIDEQFRMMGANIIVVMPGAGFTTFGSTASTVTNHDVDIIKKINGVDLATGILMRTAKVEYADEIKYTRVSGMPTDETQDVILNMQQVRILEGQKRFKEGDKYKAAVGYLLGTGDFFEKPVKVRDNIFINNQEFKVAAIVDKLGSPDDDSTIWIPLDTAREIFKEPDKLTMIMVQVKDGFEPSEVAEDIKRELREDRGLKRGEEDFTVQTSEQLKESINSVMGMVQLFVVGIAAISLLVGGVGIANTMYTSVLERTREIGVMKAVGATDRSILILFLMESGTIGLVGGVAGCLLGIGLAKAVELYAAQMGLGLLKVVATPELILGTLAFSFLVGSVAGLVPARKASRLDPVEALRYE
jgi:putative ABC transport system permease protein